MNIFKYLDYKLFLKNKIKENKKRYGYKTQLSSAAGCRASYFSQVLNADFDLSPEHALGLADFWQLRPSEKDYFIQLVHYARAGTAELRSYHESLLHKMSSESEQDLLRGNAREVTDQSKALFYSSWHYTAVHELTTFKGGRTAEAIARRLELAVDLVEETLAELETMELVEARGKTWHARIVELIVPAGSHHSSQHVAHWTGRAALDAAKRKRRTESFHKSWIFGVSARDYERLRELLLEHIARCQSIIPESEREELVCLNLNLFSV